MLMSRTEAFTVGFREDAYYNSPTGQRIGGERDVKMRRLRDDVYPESRLVPDLPPVNAPASDGVVGGDWLSCSST